MKAIVCTRYGPPEVLELREVAKPVPRAGEVLIRINATAVTASDSIVRGFRLSRWHPMGLMMGIVIGFRAPRQPILGMVFAGDVEFAGKAVTRFEPGTPVYGTTVKSAGQIRFGTYAEYICLPEDSLIVPKPADLMYEQAAALPYGYGLATSNLRRGDIQAGQHVLIYGASGAIGTIAVQLAQGFGAHVTGVCSTRNVELVRSLGAGNVIDYTQQDAPDRDQRYDLILDAVGKAKSSPFKEKLRSALAPTGDYISVDDGSPSYTIDDMWFLNELVEAGKLRAVIDRTFPLEQMVEAHRYVDAGHKSGNVIITVDHTG